MTIDRTVSMRVAASLCVAALALHAQEPINGSPNRPAGEGEGPFERLVIRGATVIDGTGAPPRGPVDIVIEGNRLRELRTVGTPGVAINPAFRPARGAREIDATGMYVLPGFVDLHVHTGGSPKAPNAEYVHKLWLAHGVTTVRGVPAGDMDWSLKERDRSAKNQITAPRIFAYHRPFTGQGWTDPPVRTAETAREWVRWAAGKGIDGLKLGAQDPEIMAALLDEAKKLGLGSTAHLDQLGVGRMNARDAVRLGLGTVTHYYGIFEALLKDSSIQPWPLDFNYNNEQDRFGQVARLWDKIHRARQQGVGRTARRVPAAQDRARSDDGVVHREPRPHTDAHRGVARQVHAALAVAILRAGRTSHGSYWYYSATAPIGITGPPKMKSRGRISTACG